MWMIKWMINAFTQTRSALLLFIQWRWNFDSFLEESLVNEFSVRIPFFPTALFFSFDVFPFKSMHPVWMPFPIVPIVDKLTGRKLFLFTPFSGANRSLTCQLASFGAGSRNRKSTGAHQRKKYNFNWSTDQCWNKTAFLRKKEKKEEEKRWWWRSANIDGSRLILSYCYRLLNEIKIIFILETV